jgi:hypothetical protein
MSVETTEIAVIDNNVAAVPGLGSELANLAKGSIAGYSSNKATDFASRVGIVNAMTNAVPVADNLGKTINLKDVVIQSVSLVNERTGELQEVPRITLIDADGTAYSATSDVIFKDLKNFFAILGEPNNWPAPLPVTVTKEKAKVGQLFRLSIVTPSGK